jgi:FtsH-binding integral membrane protein
MIGSSAEPPFASTVETSGQTGRNYSRRYLEMTRLYRAGLILLGLLSLVSLTSPLTTDGQHPPMMIALIDAGVGLIGIVLVILAWRGRMAAAIALIVVRLLAALTAVPAFLVPGVPTGPMIAAGFGIGLTVVGAALVLAGLRRPALVSAR